MHFQASTPNWKPALLAMPDGAVFKAFDVGLLRDAKETWTAADRNPRQLITVLRHHDVYTAPEGTLAQAREHWREMFRRYLDGTFYDQYAPFVDIFSESNEYTSGSTWTDRTEAAKALRNMQAVADVFNGEYRGKRGIRADARIALMAGPVGNAWPRAVTQLAVSTDSYLDYHPYELCLDGVRAADSWRNHSGLWHFIEQRDGLKPRWLFGESGPYRDAVQGWRHELCLAGDENKLVAVMAAWWADCATTPAYREGRIAGPGCWFTSGNVGWEFYQLEAAQLLKLAEACRVVWKPGQPADGDDMDAELKRQLLELAGGMKASAESMIALLEGDEPAPVHDLRDKTNQAVINVFSKAFGPAAYIVKIGQAVGTYPIYQNRAALYTGPAIESMPISDSDKAELIAALG